MTKFEAGKKYRSPQWANEMLCKFADSEFVLMTYTAFSNPHVFYTDRIDEYDFVEVREPREWVLEYMVGHSFRAVEGDSLEVFDKVRVREVLE